MGGFKIALALLALGLGGPARAADMPVKALPPPAPVLTWTGCYLGVNVGGGWGRVNYVDTLPPAAGFGGHAVSGILAGGQIGCDYQFNSIVIGVQGLADWANVDGDHLNPAGNINRTEIPWLSAATARLGFTVTPNVLIYARGGGAFAGSRERILAGATQLPIATADFTRTGWAAGGGIEFLAAQNWSVYAEYDYLGFGNRGENFTLVGVAPLLPLNLKQNVQMYTVGVNYRFNMGGMR